MNLLAKTEELRSLKVARSWIPNDGKLVSLATMFRWASKGCKGVKLQTLRTPRGTFTSREAVAEFLADIDAVRRSDEVTDATVEQLRAAGLRGAS